jgi:hypothetical protein
MQPPYRRCQQDDGRSCICRFPKTRRRQADYKKKGGPFLWSKKTESTEKYHWPRLLQEEVVTLTSEQLNWLLDVGVIYDHRAYHSRGDCFPDSTAAAPRLSTIEPAASDTIAATRRTDSAASCH